MPIDYDELIRDHPDLFDNRDAAIEVITDKAVISEWQTTKVAELRKQGKPNSWSEIGVVYEDPYIVVLRDLVKLPNGQLTGYFRLINRADLSGGQGVVILPLYQEQVVILRQYRHTTRSWHWELPRGFGEPNMPAHMNARAEIREEIEGEIEELIDLGSFHCNTGAERNETLLFIAKLSSIGVPRIDEGISGFRLAPIPEFEEMIRSGEVTDGFSFAAYTRAKLLGLI